VDGVHTNLSCQLIEDKAIGEALAEAFTRCIQPTGPLAYRRIANDRFKQRIDRVVSQDQPIAAPIVKGEHQPRGRPHHLPRRESARIDVFQTSGGGMVWRNLQQQRARAGGAVLIGMTSPRRTDQDIPWPHRMQIGTIAFRVRSCEQDADLEQIMLMSRDAQRSLMHGFTKAKPVDSDLVTGLSVRRDRGCHDTSQLLVSLYPEFEEH
jgi:hypothetical protein